jgi:hypothetical protein
MIKMDPAPEKKITMKKWMLKNKYILGGAILGGIGGYLYYHFIGCASGTCMITSKPLNSILYFGLIGAIFLSIFKKKDDGSRKPS